MNKIKIKSRKLGFTLIELLVVVAILGIIAATGIVMYTGYVSGAKQKSVENILQQIALGQTEYYSDDGYYFGNGTGCSPSSTTVSAIQGTSGVLEGAQVITEELGYLVCVDAATQNSQTYNIIAQETNGNCKIEMNHNGAITRTGC